MKNKAILAFTSKSDKVVKYGKWVYKFGVLYFNWWVIADQSCGKLQTYPRRKLVDCGHEYATYYSIEKAIKFIEKEGKIC